MPGSDGKADRIQKDIVVISGIAGTP